MFEPDIPQTNHLLGVEAWAQWEAHFAGRDAQIGEFLCMMPARVAHVRETNFTLWEHWERRMLTEGAARREEIAARQRKARRWIAESARTDREIAALYGPPSPVHRAALRLLAWLEMPAVSWAVILLAAAILLGRRLLP